MSNFLTTASLCASVKKLPLSQQVFSINLAPLSFSRPLPPILLCFSQFYEKCRNSVSFVTLPLDHADELFPGTLKRATEAKQELLWSLADVDEVKLGRRGEEVGGGTH